MLPGVNGGSGLSLSSDPRSVDIFDHLRLYLFKQKIDSRISDVKQDLDDLQSAIEFKKGFIEFAVRTAADASRQVGVEAFKDIGAAVTKLVASFIPGHSTPKDVTTASFLKQLSVAKNVGEVLGHTLSVPFEYLVRLAPITLELGSAYNELGSLYLKHFWTNLEVQFLEQISASIDVQLSHVSETWARYRAIPFLPDQGQPVQIKSLCIDDRNDDLYQVEFELFDAPLGTTVRVDVYNRRESPDDPEDLSPYDEHAVFRNNSKGWLVVYSSLPSYRARVSGDRLQVRIPRGGDGADRIQIRTNSALVRTEYYQSWDCDAPGSPCHDRPTDTC